MRQKLETIFQETIMKAIDAQYIVNPNKQLIDTLDDMIVSPEQLSETIMEMFDLSKDRADVITFNWLFDNEYENIKEGWSFTWFQGYHNTTVFAGPNGQLNLPYETFTLSGTSNTIVIGNDNVITTTTTNNNGRIYSGATLSNYFLSCDPATGSDSCITIQMHPDGTHEYINE